MRVLVTGAGGQLGRELVDAFSSPDSAHIDVVACDRTALDVADRDQCLAVLGTTMPDAVVHAGAYTDVDGCQTDPDRAWAVNALGTRNLAEAARHVGARVCYVSTDYVFDGTSSLPYTEWHPTNPASVYGRSKLAGEAALGADDTVVRTSWVCGRHGRNFVKTILGRAGKGESLTVVDDQHGCPTFADDLAVMIRTLVVARRPGVFHVTNQGPTTWYRFAVDIVAAAGLDVGLVTPIATEDYLRSTGGDRGRQQAQDSRRPPTGDLRPVRPAPRPANSVLDNAALRLSGMPLLDDHHEPLERLVKELANAY